MNKLTIKNTFVKNKNVRNFKEMMKALELGTGEGRLGVVWGKAGRGKTRTTQWHMAQSNAIYLRILTIWKSSDIPFLQALLKEFGIMNAPYRRDKCFAMILEKLFQEKGSKIIFLDEMEKLPFSYIEIIRDIADMTGCCFVLVGEEELIGYMQRSRRVWSRVFRSLEFKQIEIADIIVYTKEATQITLTAEIAGLIHQASGGDFRLVKRTIVNLVQTLNAANTTTVTKEIAKTAIKQSLQGR